MTGMQLILSLVLAMMVFSVSLELKITDFSQVLKAPKPILVGLIPQFFLLPLATFLATLVLDLPANIETAMILVACCPGGSLSNYVTHLGRGNTALSISLSAVASILALFLTPFNFAWMVAANPVTKTWLTQIAVDPKAIFFSLLFILAIPLALGLLFSHKNPEFTRKIKKPLANLAFAALGAFILLGLLKERSSLTLALIPTLLIVIAHNGLGLFLGWLTSILAKVTKPDRRAIMIEGGMQNSGLALGIILLQFNNDFGMVILASLWGIWHIVSGMACAFYWRKQDGL